MHAVFRSSLCLVMCSTLYAAETPREIGSANEKPISVSSILENYVHAAGGSLLLQISTERRTGTLLRGRTGAIPFEISAMAPGRWLYHQTFAYGDQVRYGSDGDEGWIQDTKSVELMNQRQFFDFQLLFDPRAPLGVSELYPEMEVIGEEKVCHRDAHTVLATSANGISTELAFDRETGLLLRAGGMIFESYEEVNGVARPARILLGETDEEHHLQMVVTISETRHGIDLNEAVFTKPESILPLTEAPLYTTRVETAVSLDAMDACVGLYRHPEQADVIYTVTRHNNHLMLHRTGWPLERELKPASETEYFFRFPGTDFRFIKDGFGRVTHLEIADGTIRAARVH